MRRGGEDPFFYAPSLWKHCAAILTHILLLCSQWDNDRIGWHEADIHEVWKEHGERVIPGLFAASDKPDSETCTTNNQDNNNNSPVSVFVPLCGKTVDMARLATSPAVSRVVGVDGIRKALETFAEEQPQLEIRAVGAAADDDDDSSKKYSRGRPSQPVTLHCKLTRSFHRANRSEFSSTIIVAVNAKAQGSVTNNETSTTAVVVIFIL